MFRRIVLLWAFFSVVVSGCGGSQESYVVTGSPLAAATPSSSGPFKLQPDVVVLDAAKTTVLGLDEGAATIAGTPEGVAIGSVVIMNSGSRQFAGRVSGLSSEAGNTVVTFSPIGLTDIFSQANIEEQFTLPPETLRQLQPALPGIEIGEPVAVSSPQLTTNKQALGKIVQLYEIPLKFTAVNIGEGLGLGFADANVTGGLRVLVNGEVKIRFLLDVALNIQPGLPPLVNARFVPIAQVSGSLTTDTEIGGSYHLRFPLTLPLTAPIAAIGPVPITANLQFFGSLSGAGSSREQTLYQGTAEVKLGLEVVNNEPRLVSGFTADGRQGTAQSGQFVQELSWLGPEANLQILGCGTAYMAFEPMVFRKTVEVNSSNTERTERMEYKVRGRVGAALRVFSFSLIDRNFPLFEQSKVFEEKKTRITPPVQKPAAIILVGDQTVDTFDTGSYATLGLFLRQIGPVLLPIYEPIFSDFTSSLSGIMELAPSRGYGTAGQTFGNSGKVTLSTRDVFSGLFTTLEVNVLGKSPTALELTSGFSSQVPLRTNFQTRALLRYSDGSSEDVTSRCTFASDSSAIVHVGGGAFQALEARSANLTASLGSRQGKLTLTVSRPAIERLFCKTLPVAPLQVDGVFRQEILAQLRDGNQSTSIPSRTGFLVEDPSIISVTPDDASDSFVIRGLKAGRSRVQYTRDGVSTECTFTVGRKATQLTLTVDKDFYTVGDRFQVKSTIKYSDGSTSSGQFSGFRSGDPSTVSRQNELEFMARRPGVTNITQTLEGLSAQVTIVVVPADTSTPDPEPSPQPGTADGILVQSSFTDNTVSVRTVSSSGPASKATVATVDAGPRAVAVHPSRKQFYVACDGGKTIRGYSVDTSTLQLTELPGSPYPAGCSPRTIVMHPTGNHLLIGGTGTEGLRTFSIGGNGALSDITTTPVSLAANPRSMIFSNQGQHLLVGGGNGTSQSYLKVVDFNNGSPQASQEILLTDNSVNGIAVDSVHGRVYAGVRKDAAGYFNSYSQDSNGILTFLKQTNVGRIPGEMLYRKETGTLYAGSESASGILVFDVTPDTGTLTALASSPVSTSEISSNLVMSTDEKLLLATSFIANAITAFSIGSDAALTPLSSGVITGDLAGPLAAGFMPVR